MDTRTGRYRTDIGGMSLVRSVHVRIVLVVAVLLASTGVVRPSPAEAVDGFTAIPSVTWVGEFFKPAGTTFDGAPRYACIWVQHVILDVNEVGVAANDVLNTGVLWDDAAGWNRLFQNTPPTGDFWGNRIHGSSAFNPPASSSGWTPQTTAWGPGRYSVMVHSGYISSHPEPDCDNNHVRETRTGTLMLRDSVFGNRPPEASFGVNIVDEDSRQVEFFNASTDPDGDPLTSSWSFGDGSSSSARSPLHTFPTNRSSFVVTLTVTDPDGLTSTAEQTVSFGVPNEVEAAVDLERDHDSIWGNYAFDGNQYWEKVVFDASGSTALP
ncbi:MAG TPA: PKD domain-containing protein, partial [Acidimicrobiales bacterium]|nr:PKD domain-containing protein [Acidimicrobiales bacterium]